MLFPCVLDTGLKSRSWYSGKTAERRFLNLFKFFWLLLYVPKNISKANNLNFLQWTLFTSKLNISHYTVSPSEFEEEKNNVFITWKTINTTEMENLTILFLSLSIFILRFTDTGCNGTKQLIDNTHYILW
jgi:ABC-type enterochelin transport system permease subunit